MLSNQQMNDLWWEIKGGIRNVWGNLTEEEVDAHKNNLIGLSEYIHRTSGETRESIKHKMDTLMASFDNDTDKYNYSQSAFERSPLGPDAGATSDYGPGATDSALHDKDHSMNGFSEARDDVGMDYDAARVSRKKNIQDFDQDRNSRH